MFSIRPDLIEVPFVEPRNGTFGLRAEGSAPERGHHVHIVGTSIVVNHAAPRPCNSLADCTEPTADLSAPGVVCMHMIQLPCVSVPTFAILSYHIDMIMRPV